MAPPRAALIALSLLLPGPLTAQETKPPAQPSEEVIGAWKKAGLAFGWYGQGREGTADFQGNAKGLTGALPAFRPTNRQLAKLPKLPDPKVPFALDLRRTRITDKGLKDLAALPSLAALDLGLTPVTGDGLKELKGLKNLTALSLWGAEVSDAGVKGVAELKGLTRLVLSMTKISDAGLKELAELKGLTALSLSHNEVTDKGLKEIAGLKKLTSLALLYTRVTDDGVEELKKALPKCKVTR